MVLESFVGKVTRTWQENLPEEVKSKVRRAIRNMSARPPAQMTDPENSWSPHFSRAPHRYMHRGPDERCSISSWRRDREVYFDSEFGSLQSKVNVRTLDNSFACAALTRRLPRLSNAFFYCNMHSCCLSSLALLTPLRPAR